ncbi:type I phosphodiesterase/nucleotide pyrophosphatase [Candidatus Vecturithrix granuli]|uniref:Type I phosphodiesterase/nucleotide pyrophosphatase n=1 Tax=Vecturithrix granuli TaxID=1499967 RepID=A0A0S6WAJ6_VECG1|nr:type I phosphodiesterase/nucleotide pyrophosphatase [Candidatus Vecturithrix granuli]
MNRRRFLRTAFAFGVGATLFPYNAFSRAAAARKKVLMLGIDGMDVRLTEQFLRQGRLPNVQKIIARGGMAPLATSMPPQSPVAWSNIAVGGTPAIHGIYDFIHRDPATMSPFLSMSRVTPSARVLHLGEYAIPLTAGKTENLQQGKPFWAYLAERDIPTTLFKMPANFPCRGGDIEMISGMGTPDLRGGYGNFTLFTTTPESFPQDISGGRIIPVAFEGNQVSMLLPGPRNTLKKETPEVAIPISVWRDRINPVVRVVIQDHEFVLKQGEWTGWFRVEFPMIGSLVNVKGICKIYIKSVHPHFSMYVSPINIDPSEPALPIVSSEKYGKLLAEENGFFYTQGLPEDTKALSEGIFTEDEYLELARQVLEERKKLLFFEFERFNRRESGMLFFYVSSIDQNSHMYWRAIDPKHPQYSPELSGHYGDILVGYYTQVDGFLGQILEQYDISDPNLTLMIMSDHGFGSFRRQVNVNTWLYENGYLALSGADALERNDYFSGVNWKRTGAYNLGINSIYLNLKGREKQGVVLENQAAGLKTALREELMALVDPASDERAVADVRIVPDAEHARHPHAPDLIVGWNDGYRTSWNSILGGFSPDIFADNLDKWSGDHCVDPSVVPAIMISNKPIVKPQPALWDIAPTVLQEFGIEGSEEIEGEALYTVGSG